MAQNEGIVTIALKREYASMLLDRISHSFKAEGYEGALALIEICDALKDALIEDA